MPEDNINNIKSKKNHGSTMSLIGRNENLNLVWELKKNDLHINFERYFVRELSAVLMNGVPEVRPSADGKSM